MGHKDAARGWSILSSWDAGVKDCGLGGFSLRGDS